MATTQLRLDTQAQDATLIPSKISTSPTDDFSFPRDVTAAQDLITNRNVQLQDDGLINLNTAGSSYLWYDTGNTKLELNSAQYLDLLVNNGNRIARIDIDGVVLDDTKKLYLDTGKSVYLWQTDANNYEFTSDGSEALSIKINGVYSWQVTESDVSGGVGTAPGDWAMYLPQGTSAAPVILMGSSAGLYSGNGSAVDISSGGSDVARFSDAGISLAVDGTGSNPSYTFNTDAGTGMSLDNAGTFAPYLVLSANAQPVVTISEGDLLQVTGAVEDGDTKAFITVKNSTTYGSSESGTVDIVELLDSTDQQTMRMRRNSQGYFEIVNTSQFQDTADLAFYIEQVGDAPIYLRTNGNDVVTVNSDNIQVAGRVETPEVTSALDDTPMFTATGSVDTGMAIVTDPSQEVDFWANGTKVVRISSDNGGLIITDPNATGTIGIRNQDGSATDPSYTFVSEPGTGMFWQGVNQIGFSLGGSNVAAFSGTGDFSLLTGSLYIDKLGDASDPTIGMGPAGSTGFFLPTADSLSVTAQSTEIARFTTTNVELFSSLLNIDGTGAAPSYSFSSDPNTGIFLSGADQLGISANGADQVYISPTLFRVVNAQVQVSDGSASAPAYSFANQPDTGMSLNGNAVEFSSDGTAKVRVESTSFHIVDDIQILARQDNAATPGYSFQDDPNSGVYSSAADQVSVSLGGSQKVIFSADDNLAQVRVTAEGSQAFPAFAGTVAIDTGMYFPNTRLGFSVLGDEIVRMIETGLVPGGVTTGTFDLGSNSLHWKDFYTQTITNNDGDLVILAGGGNIIQLDPGGDEVRFLGDARPHADNNWDIGADTEEWKDLWIHNIKHNSVGLPHLTIATTGNNGNIIIDPHGTGHISASGAQVKDVADPTAMQDAATKAYVDSVAAGLDPKASVRLGTLVDVPGYVTGTITIPNNNATYFPNAAAAAVVDGITIAVGNRILVKDQSDPVQNGIYEVTDAGVEGTTDAVLTRSTDMDGSPANEISGGNFTFIEFGTQSGQGWTIVWDGDVVLDTDPINWTQFSQQGSGTVNAGIAGRFSYYPVSGNSVDDAPTLTTNGTDRVNVVSSDISVEDDQRVILGNGDNAWIKYDTAVGGISVQSSAGTAQISTDGTQLILAADGANTFNPSIALDASLDYIQFVTSGGTPDIEILNTGVLRLRSAQQLDFGTTGNVWMKYNSSDQIIQWRAQTAAEGTDFGSDDYFDIVANIEGGAGSYEPWFSMGNTGRVLFQNLSHGTTTNRHFSMAFDQGVTVNGFNTILRLSRNSEGASPYLEAGYDSNGTIVTGSRIRGSNLTVESLSPLNLVADSVNISSKILNADGDSSLPAYSFVNNPDTGFYLGGSGVDVAVDGSQIALFTSDGIFLPSGKSLTIGDSGDEIAQNGSDIIIRNNSTTIATFAADRLTSTVAIRSKSGGSAGAPDIEVGSATTGLFNSTGGSNFNITVGGSNVWFHNGVQWESGSPVRFIAGSAGSASQSFTGDPDTGIFSPGGNIWAVTAGGTERARIDSTGIKTINGSAASPSYSFTSDPDTGFAINSSFGANAIDVVTGGVAGFTFIREGVTSNYQLFAQVLGSSTRPVFSQWGSSTSGLYFGGSGEFNWSVGGTQVAEFSSSLADFMGLDVRIDDNNRVIFGNSDNAHVKYSTDHSGIYIQSGVSAADINFPRGANIYANTETDGSGEYFPAINLTSNGLGGGAVTIESNVGTGGNNTSGMAIYMTNDDGATTTQDFEVLGIGRNSSGVMRLGYHIGPSAGVPDSNFWEASIQTMVRVGSTLSYIMQTDGDIDFYEDIRMFQDKSVFLTNDDAALIKFSSDHGGIYYQSEAPSSNSGLLATPSWMGLYSHTNTDASGTWEPSIELRDGSVQIYNMNEGTLTERQLRLGFDQGVAVTGFNPVLVMLRQNIPDTYLKFGYDSNGTIVTGSRIQGTNLTIESLSPMNLVATTVIISNDATITGIAKTDTLESRTGDLTIQTTNVNVGMFLTRDPGSENVQFYTPNVNLQLDENSGQLIVQAPNGIQADDLHFPNTLSISTTQNNGNISFSTHGSGVVTVNSRVLVSNGSESAPSYSFTNQTNGGLFVNPGDNNSISFVQNGTTLIYASDTQCSITPNATEIAIQADINLAGSYKVINLPTPTNAQDAATKAYVDSVAAGLDPKASVRVASTADIDLTTGGLLTIDTVTVVDGDRVLVKDQSDPTENGIYIAHAGAWTRSTDMDGSPANEISGGNFTFVEAGTQEGTGWTIIWDGDIVLNTDPINWTQFSSAGDLVAGNGIDITFPTISVKHDGAGLTFSGSDLSLELDGTSLSKSASGVRVADAGVTYAMSNVVTRETPSGTVDGVNAVFTLAFSAAAGSEMVFLNGLLQDEGGSNDYTISGDTITFNTAPLAGSKIRVTYWKA